MKNKKISNSLEDLGKLLFSEDYTPAPALHDNEKDSLPMQHLEAHFSNKGRGGKTVTIIKGFQGSESQLKELAKSIKSKIAVGGSTKNGEIIIQGDYREKIIDILKAMGHQTKRVGG